MNTPAALDHRAFLQQFVLACVACDWADPNSMLKAADIAWEGIEKTVVEEARRRAPEELADALRRAVPAPPDGWSQTEPSGYVAKYPTTGEPLATPEVGTISATPPNGECRCLPGGGLYYWSDANLAFKCCGCHKIISAMKGVPKPTPMSKRP